MASLVFASLPYDEGGRFLIGFRVAENYFGIRPQLICKENRHATPVDRQGPCVLEELLAVEIGSNNLHLQFKFGRSCRDRIGQRILPFFDPVRVNRKAIYRRQGLRAPKPFHKNFTTRIASMGGHVKSCRLMIMAGLRRLLENWNAGHDIADSPGKQYHCIQQFKVFPESGRPVPRWKQVMRVRFLQNR